MTEPRRMKPKPLPFAEPPEFDDADIYAVKAVWAGVANAGQQQRAMRWIMEKAAKIDRDPFRADPRLSEHLIGRQSVGRMILALVNTIMPESK